MHTTRHRIAHTWWQYCAVRITTVSSQTSAAKTLSHRWGSAPFALSLPLSLHSRRRRSYSRVRLPFVECVFHLEWNDLAFSIGCESGCTGLRSISDGCWQLWAFQYWISFKPLGEASTVKDKFPSFYQQPFFTVVWLRKCALFAPHSQSKHRATNGKCDLHSFVAPALGCHLRIAMQRYLHQTSVDNWLFTVQT